ncbi:MAG: hypothetical protein AAFN77_00555 [Planctomycetota bacterium]
MRFRIGYGGPKEYRHGRYYPGGRVNNGGMTEIERLIHLIASMQILFGSRPGGWVIPLVIVALAVTGWMAYRNYNSSDSAYENAMALYDSSDTQDKLKAIKEFKRLLVKVDRIEPGTFFLTKDREKLYRIIIRHEVMFAEDEATAYDWFDKAWDEGITSLRFNDERVQTFWNESTSKRKTGKRRPRNKSPTTSSEDPQKASQFNEIPGLDN